jgi:DNA helicase IV
VIVDEAQDLSPMQWRMIARRCPTGSMTIVGDLGQSKHPWAPASWEQVCQTAAPDHPVRIVELAINYRTPTEVMNLACCVLAVHAPTLVPPKAVRSVGTEPQIINVSDPRRLVAQAPQFAARELETVRPGKVAILRPTPTTTPNSPRSRRSTQNSRDILDEEIAELEIDQAKGLEFDAVIVLEPADFSPGELYVALTRTTDRLVLLHSGELPPILNSYAG